MEAENLQKHLGLAEESFLTLGKKDQAKVGGRLKKLLHTVSDGAFLPLMSFCLEKCHVRILCTLKGIKTDELSSSLQLKVEDVKKEEPKEGPNDEVKEEPIDSDVDERMAEADADIEAQVWNTGDGGHGNGKDVSECASRLSSTPNVSTPPPHLNHHEKLLELLALKAANANLDDQVRNLEDRLRPHPLVQQPMYNEEHVFKEDGRQVRKMPIKVNGDTLWVDSRIVERVDCVPQSTLDKGVADGGIMLNFDDNKLVDTNEAVPPPQGQQQQPQHQQVVHQGAQPGQQVHQQQQPQQQLQQQGVRHRGGGEVRQWQQG